MTNMLHIINKSPTERNSLDSCLRTAASASAILFIEDGVYAALEKAATAGNIKPRIQEFKFYVLGPDIAARGLSDLPLIAGIEIVDYEGFVDLVAKHHVAQSWL